MVVEQNPIDKIRDAIETHTGPGRPGTGGSWSLRCPAHPDRQASLVLSENGQHHALVWCGAGCTTQEILDAVDLSMRDLYPPRSGDNQRKDPVVAVYPYVDETGELLFEVLRTAAKHFYQRKPGYGQHLYKLDGVRRVLYRLPVIVDAIRTGQTIYLVEGEKDVHSVEAAGAVATTNPGGAGKWRDEYTQQLAGAHIVIVVDRDQSGVGLKHGRDVYHRLQSVAASVTLTQPAVPKDITDHLVSGLSLDDVELVGVSTPQDLPGPLREPPGYLEDAPEPVSPGEVQGPKPTIRLTPASAFRIRAVKWAWDERIPIGEICLVAGREGIGKSTFLSWLTAMITRGELPGEFHGHPRAVLYGASEDAWDYTIAPRMHAAGADLSMVYRVDVVSVEGVPGKLILPTHTDLIPDAARDVKAAFLMLDPVVSNIHEAINPNHGRELRKALEPLRDATEAAGVATVGLAHLNKTRDVDLATMVSGARTWLEVARAAIAIARDEREDPNTGDTDRVQVLSQIKNNLGSLDLPSLEYRLEAYEFPIEEDSTEVARVGRVEWLDNPSGVTAEEVISRARGRRGEPREPAEGTGRSTADLILDALDDAGRAMSVAELADAADASRNATRQALLRLSRAGRVQRLTDGVYQAADPSVTRNGE